MAAYRYCCRRSRGQFSLLAIVAFWIVFLSGERGLAPVAGEVARGSLAAQSGFESGTEIIAVDAVPTKTWSAVSRQLFGFIGTTGDIPFTVTYPDSTIQYQLLVPVNKWLRDERSQHRCASLVSSAISAGVPQPGGCLGGGAGYRAGLRAGDRLLAINGTEITSINGFIDTVASSAGSIVDLVVERNEGQQLAIQAVPQLVERDGQMVGQLGVQLASQGRYPETLLRTIDHGFFGALARATGETVETSFFVLESIGKLIVGDLSPKNLSGPITITKVAGDTAKAGFDNFIRFIAFSV